MVREKSCGAVTVFFRISKREKKPLYLLLYYEAGHWDFPKGNVEKGEKEQETALREVKEETGLAGQIIEGFRDRITYFYRRKGKTVFKEVIFFIVEVPSQKVKISWEHVGYKWLPYEEAMAQLTFKNAKEILQKANDFLKGGKRPKQKRLL